MFERGRSISYKMSYAANEGPSILLIRVFIAHL